MKVLCAPSSACGRWPVFIPQWKDKVLEAFSHRRKFALAPLGAGIAALVIPLLPVGQSGWQSGQSDYGAGSGAVVAISPSKLVVDLTPVDKASTPPSAFSPTGAVVGGYSDVQLSVSTVIKSTLGVSSPAQMIAQADNAGMVLIAPKGPVAPPPAVATAAGGNMGSSENQHVVVGMASWYGAPPGTCASPYLPFGTKVSLVNLNNGAQTVCIVADRGPYLDGRILDLSTWSFSQLESTYIGVIPVRASW